MSDAITPFQISTSQAVLDDLQSRLNATRWPEAETPADWSQGMPLNYTRELTRYWAERYDWRATEQRLNALPQFVTELDGLPIHFLHVRSPEADARPLLLTHGWPGSMVEFLEVLGPLTDPRKHGASSRHAFHVVCPTLPGFGFSGKPTTPGWGVERVARAWDELMLRLGYTAYFAQGGDWGAIVTSEIGVQNRGHCRGLHVNMAIVTPDPDTLDAPTPDEQKALDALQHYRDWDSGYSRQQATRPQTLGYSLVDSPVAQLAWVVEKFHAWTDCNGHPENSVSRQALLDNVMLYWLTASGASSARIYWESFGQGHHEPIDIPAGISVFPKEIMQTSERWAKRRFRDLRLFRRHRRGGHFAAIEVPDLWLADVRATFANLTFQE